MQEPPVQPFDDPALKAALRRAAGQEAAPAGLRDKIRAAAAADQATHRPIASFRQSPLYRFAAAAVLIIGFGALGYQIWQANRPPKYDAAVAISPSLYKDMVDVHKARAGGSATPDTVTRLDAARQLATKVNRPVFVPDLTGDGWAFQGGAVRDVSGHPTPQLFYTKGATTLSVYSLPREAALYAQDGMTYAVSVSGMPIAGFAGQGGLFCIVGDGKLGLDEVKSLLERHRGEIRSQG